MRWKCENCKNYNFCKRSKMRICIKDYSKVEIVMDIIGAVATIASCVLILVLTIMFFIA